MPSETSTHVVFLGFGAVGRHLARLLRPELEDDRIRLTAAVRDLSRHEDSPESGGVQLVQIDTPGLETAIDSAEIVVEAAGVAPASTYGPRLIAAGQDVVLTSVGALADAEIASDLLAGPGRLWVTHGAIGGLDMLSSLAEAEGLDRVEITTSTPPRGLIQPWMDEDQQSRLEQLGADHQPLTVFSGSPREALDAFPDNAHVGVALAWATRGLSESPEQNVHLMQASLDRVELTLVADPGLRDARHDITASGSAGRFNFTFEAAPSPENPHTSITTALSVAHTLRQVLERLGRRKPPTARKSRTRMRTWEDQA
ncbi:aspartate dehydrogenase [Auritidibacter sp. NML120779]|nr:aspartate dehydrogenase [Auritidibacter sp. NML120779]